MRWCRWARGTWQFPAGCLGGGDRGRPVGGVCLRLCPTAAGNFRVVWTVRVLVSVPGGVKALKFSCLILSALSSTQAAPLSLRPNRLYLLR
jgi:hypothetical protein